MAVTVNGESGEDRSGQIGDDSDVGGKSMCKSIPLVAQSNGSVYTCMSAYQNGRSCTAQWCDSTYMDAATLP